MWTLECVCVLIIGLVGINNAEWHYDPDVHDRDPADWATLPDSMCSGQNQSPINIPAVTEVEYESIGSFRLKEFSDPSKYKTTLTNNGHSLQVNVDGPLTISGGGLPGTNFKMAQFHFHWGSDDTRGSEHTYHGRHFPMEMHVVTYNTKYSNISVAQKESDGLAVLGFWFILIESTNTAFNPIVNHIHNVSNKGSSVVISLNIRDLFPRQLNRFFRYKGSLTTPLCYESVKWSMFDDRISISHEQMAKFRTVSGDTTGQGNIIVDNFRSIRPLNGRKLVRSFQLESELNAAAPVTSFGLTLTLIAVIVHVTVC